MSLHHQLTDYCIRARVHRYPRVSALCPVIAQLEHRVRPELQNLKGRRNGLTLEPPPDNCAIGGRNHDIECYGSTGDVELDMSIACVPYYEGDRNGLSAREPLRSLDIESEFFAVDLGHTRIYRFGDPRSRGPLCLVLVARCVVGRGAALLRV